MSTGWLIVSEILFRKATFAFGCAAIALVVCILTASVAISRSDSFAQMQILREREIKSDSVMKAFEDSCEQITRRMGFTHRIIPAGQTEIDFFADGFARGTIAKENLDRLASLHSPLIAGMVPVLRQKTWWPEQKRSIIICGTGPLSKDPPQHTEAVFPAPLAAESVIVGYELAHDLRIQPHQRITICGKSFTVESSADQKGSVEDITISTTLEDAQEILSAPNTFSEIRVWASPLQSTGPDLRALLSTAFPGSAVIELTGRTAIGERSRIAAMSASMASIERDRVRSTGIASRRSRLNRLIALVCGIGSFFWITGLSFDNLHSRRAEIGLLRSLGISKSAVFTLFIARVAAIGFIGALAGCFLGILGAGTVAMHRYPLHFSLAYLALPLVLTPLCTSIAGLLPALRAAQQDPAEILMAE